MNIVNKYSKLILTAALTLIASASFAGTFTRVEKAEKEGIQVFTYEGTIEPGDVRKFEELLDRKDHIFVSIKSGGGNWKAGLDLGRATMKRRDEVTLICDASYSAAALWFLADDDGIFLDDAKSEYGLHLPYVYGGQLTEAESQTIGYMMGRYLEDILGDEAGALKLMEKLTNLRDTHGKFALLIISAKGKVTIKK